MTCISYYEVFLYKVLGKHCLQTQHTSPILFSQGFGNNTNSLHVQIRDVFAGPKRFPTSLTYDSGKHLCASLSHNIIWAQQVHKFHMSIPKLMQFFNMWLVIVYMGWWHLTPKTYIVHQRWLGKPMLMYNRRRWKLWGSTFDEEGRGRGSLWSPRLTRQCELHSLFLDSQREFRKMNKCCATWPAFFVYRCLIDIPLFPGTSPSLSPLDHCEENWSKGLRGCSRWWRLKPSIVSLRWSVGLCCHLFLLRP